jgi:hypothetical protein
MNPIKRSVDDFLYWMQIKGGMLFDTIVPHQLCDEMKVSIFSHYEKNRAIQIKSGVGDIGEWGSHHFCGSPDAIHDFLAADYLHDYLTAYFDGKQYILNTISASINPPKEVSGAYEHARKWHRDIRTYVGNGNRQLIVMLVMLDDFTEANGATEILEGSHHAEAFPPESYITENKYTATGSKGSIILYDGDIFHRAGKNTTDKFRIGLTCTFTRAYFKQQLDYPRMLSSEYASTLTPRMRQLYGFNARTPSTMEEWYQTSENRFYKSDQG